MKLAVSAVVAFGMLGTLPFVVPEDGGDQATSVKPIVQGRESPLSYKLRVLGQEGACTVVKHGKAGAKHAELELEGGCAALMPRLAEARYWREKAGGDLVFVTADGRPVVEFFAADGVAYESLKPVSPLVALTVQ